jgi:hypothetical protein
MKNAYTHHLRRRARKVVTAARKEITEAPSWTWTR